ncbi:MAG: hypothetical protein KGL39_38835 [Patescibacteria group bacterium]|nr:hypothetical protein [Patescibacteria group bacterium]
MATKEEVRNLRPSVKFKDEEQARKVYVKSADKGVKLTKLFQEWCDKFLAEK